MLFYLSDVATWAGQLPGGPRKRPVEQGFPTRNRAGSRKVWQFRGLAATRWAMRQQTAGSYRLESLSRRERGVGVRVRSKSMEQSAIHPGRRVATRLSVHALADLRGAPSSALRAPSPEGEGISGARPRW
ncbi:hypothetical protein XAC3810_260128 [Xanthomonas citri pv. citri]|uniref:Uncharacterized protein n=1 Tax=Xanthomonas citri pv. citri TaxID=611301 RepID=A0A0U5FC60_XANCI|nr:hypothetical protein XAC3824_280009 [Xanthomonas citri pv. citri]CEE22427.1 hypothetical protein XAC9322_270059 [Xanthomonas citri pv. citri]CEE23989.1 hypothetical protein XAC1083_260110 [Xanthomonas citri pv. citri]CEE32376.1 hypothetical protein XAC3810_260128 [Xanthomonas citri pv. citri]CEE34776.1 hypothetical protein XAC902_330060 [Xanthomonas citri pv. citri]